MGRLSKEQIIEKVTHYKNNYIDFIKDFGKIRVPGGIIDFNMFEYQKDLVNKLSNFDFNIILKARQLGISTIISAYLGTYIIFNPHSDIIIIAINEDVAKELILKIKIFLEGLPKYIRPIIVNPRNKESIDLANGSRVKALTSTSKSGRSFTASFLVLDEAAFIDGVDELWTSAYPTVSNGGKAILLSTPNGENNLFHDIWTAAENDNNEFASTKIYWWEMPGRDETWKSRTLANMRYDKKRFEQEYECSFAASSKSVIALNVINKLLKENKEATIIQQPNFVSKQGKTYDNIAVYKFPVKGHKYLISADTAEGLGEERDASAFIIQDLMTDEVVGEFADKDLNEKRFSKVLLDIAETFNNALVVIELKSTGKAVANYLLEWKYKYLIWMDKRMSLFLDPYSKRVVPSHYQYDKKNNVIPGFFTNASNKIMFVAEMRNQVEEAEITKIYTTKMLEQQKSFVNKGGTVSPKYGASGRNNDDLVVAFGIGVFIKKFIWKIIENNNILTQEILDLYARKIDTMADSDILTETTIFAPIYKTGAFKRKSNPYRNPLSDLYGDSRDLLENYTIDKSKKTSESKQ